MNFSAVILAGGRSSRMGQDKAWLPFNATTLIEHSLCTVQEAGAGEVLISGRAGQDFSAYGCPVLLDLTPDCGPLGGIERALDVAAHPLVLVLAVDLPHMTPGCLRWLLADGRDAFHRVPIIDGEVAVKSVPTEAPPDVKSSAGRAAMGVIPILNGQLEPLVAAYPKQAHEIVRRMLGEERLAAREFAKACIDQGLARGMPVLIEHKQCFANWNTPEDMAASRMRS